MVFFVRRTRCHKRYQRELQQQQQRLPTIDSDPVVGHQYGEKPLLLDDELDVDSKPEQQFGDPFVKHQYESNNCEDKIIVDSLKNGGRPDEDVFALAPFPKSSSSSRQNSINQDLDLYTVVASTPLKRDSKREKVEDLFGSVPFTAGKFGDQLQSSSANCFADTTNSSYQFQVRTNLSSRRGNNFNNSGKEKFNSCIIVNSNSEDLFGSTPFEQLTSINSTTLEANGPIVQVAKSQIFIGDSNLCNNSNMNDCSLSSVTHGKSFSHKKSTKSKKSHVVTTGISNMSFEDFPSDENDDRRVTSVATAPFELVREPEKRFGSLKRRSNPFI